MSTRPFITVEEFVTLYVTGSECTPEELAAHGRVVVRCECDFEECQGWAMVGREIVATIREVHERGGPLILGGTDYSRVYWPVDDGEGGA